PFSSVAARVTFMSVLSSAFAVLFTFLLTVRLAKLSFKVHDWKAWLAGLVASFFMAFSNTFWWNGTEAEVYAVSSFAMVVTFWMAFKWWDSFGKDHSDRMLLLIAFVLSLCIGIHLGTLLVTPGIFVLVLLVDWRTLLKPKLLAFVAALVVLGVSVHFYLLIRSRLDPAINEAAPKTWRDLWLVLERDQYKPGSIFVRRAEFSFQVDMFWRYFSNQFTLFGGRFEALGRYVPLLLGILGAYFHAVGNRKTFAALLTVFLVCSLGLILYLNFTDHEVRERDYFYVAAYHFFAIWIGLAATGILLRALRATREYLKNPLPVTAGVSCVFLAMSVLPGFYFHFSHDRTEDRVARNFAYNMLVPLEKDAIILTNGDNDTFPLWYIQEVEGIRKDVRVANLSLMRTSWYIKQLKNLEPRVPMSLTDSQIDYLYPFRDSSGKVWQVNEMVVHDMIKANKWEKPLYLAVTTPDQMGLDRNLILEGLAFRVTPDAVGLRLDEAKMKKNLYEDYVWEGLLRPDGTRDESFYKDISAVKLVQNYAAAFYTFAFWYRQKGDMAQAVKEMERAYEISPQFTEAAARLGQFYLEAGQLDKAERHYGLLLSQYPDVAPLHYDLGRTHLAQGKTEVAIADFRKAIELERTFQDAYYVLADTYMRLGMTSQRDAVLRAWLEVSPEDTTVRSYLDRFGTRR
ncbi:MAG: DUF2723 domain-containing protein, partial [Candidatus Eisenbacteria bacterium]